MKAGVNAFSQKKKQMNNNSEILSNLEEQTNAARNWREIIT
jgi:hypothetical protein